MAYTNKTTNYELPQYIGSDKPSYLNDFNYAMNTIDAQMKTNANSATSADSNATQALNTANNVDGKIGNLQNLDTTDKSSVVNAINEIKTEEGTIEGIVGKLSIHGKLLERTSGGATSDQSVPANTITTVLYPIEKYNQLENNEITYSNGIFTVASDKISHLLINTQLFLRNPQAITGYIQKNSTTEFSFSSNEPEARIENTFFLPVQQGDTVNIAIHLANGGALRNDVNNFVQLACF